jgi:hypothetical protein
MKRTYNAPRLAVFGTVESITLQGSRSGFIDVPKGTPVNPAGNCSS